MSSLTKLVQERKQRIELMQKLIKQDYKEWSSKRQFLAMYMINVGVRRRLAEEYYRILLDFGAIEEKKEGTEVMFRVVNDENKD